MKIVNFINGTYLYLLFHRYRALYLDVLIGGKSLTGIIPSKYKNLNAFATQSTDYRLLRPIFKSYVLKPSDVFVDVGCGKGRVLSYLLLKKFSGKIIGVELDPGFADFAQKRLNNYKNVTIICGNILNIMPKEATVFYLFNPFNEIVFRNFIDEIENNINHKVTIIYCADLFKDYLVNRKGWIIRESKTINRRFGNPMQYSIIEYLNGIV